MRPLLSSRNAPCEACNRQTVQDAARGDQVCPECGLVSGRVYDHAGPSGLMLPIGQSHGDHGRRCELGSHVGRTGPGGHMGFLARLHAQTVRHSAGKRSGTQRLVRELVTSLGLPTQLSFSGRILGEVRRIVHLTDRAGLSVQTPTAVCTAVYMTARRDGLPISVLDIARVSLECGHRMKAKFILQVISKTPELCTELAASRKTARDYFARIIDSVVTGRHEKVKLTGLTREAYECRVLLEAERIWQDTPREPISSCKPTSIASAIVYGATLLLDDKLEVPARISQRDLMECSDMANDTMKLHWQRLFAPIVRSLRI